MSLRRVSWFVASPETAPSGICRGDIVHYRMQGPPRDVLHEPCSRALVPFAQKLAKQVMTEEGFELISSDDAKNALGEDRKSTAHIIIPKALKGAIPFPRVLD